MNARTEKKLKDLSGMNKAINEILQQAWERGRKYGQKETEDQFYLDKPVLILNGKKVLLTHDHINVLLEYEKNKRITDLINRTMQNLDNIQHEKLQIGGEEIKL